MTATSLYKNVVVLDAEKHRNLRFKPFGDVRFSAGCQSALLAASEIPNCAVEYPVVFAAAKDSPVAIALLGLRHNENLMLTEDGRWDGHYVPAFLRRYPFVPATAPNGSVMIAIDDSCTNLGRADGELLIDGEGKATPFLTDLMKFIEQVHVDYARSSTFVKALAERGLLRDMNADVRTDAGHKFSVTGFQIVDETKLAALPDADLAAMARNGELALIYAHLLSLRNLQKLANRLGKIIKPSEKAAA